MGEYDLYHRLYELLGFIDRHTMVQMERRTGLPIVQNFDKWNRSKPNFVFCVTDISIVVEVVSECVDPELVVPILSGMIDDFSPIIRESVINGLIHHHDENIRGILRRRLVNETVSVLRDSLDEFLSDNGDASPI